LAGEERRDGGEAICERRRRYAAEPATSRDGWLHRTPDRLRGLGSRRPELAGGWLVLKAAAAWRVWKKKRAVYNVFRVGTGISVSQASVGALLVSSVLARDWLQAVLLALGGLVFGAVMAIADRDPFRRLLV
jgi:hypothetical protein